MNKLLAVALTLPLVACVVGNDQVVGGGGGGDDGSGSGNPNPPPPAGHIAADVTWNGTQAIPTSVTIDPGVTVTVAAGTTVTLSPGAGITVSGILDVQGTSASPVHFSPDTTGGHYSGISIPMGGELKMAYAVQEGGGINTSGSGKATITDTALSKASGDFLVMSGGTVNVMYSSIGLEVPGQDTTHCDMHFGGTGNVIVVSHTNVSTSAYGLMFYGGQGADFTYDNWFSNTVDVDVEQGTPVQGDFSYGWFQNPPPTATGITYNNPSAVRVLDAGPRP